MVEMVVSEKAITIATGKRTLTDAIDATGEPITRPETRTLAAYMPFDPALLAGGAGAFLADGTVVPAHSPEGRRIIASKR